MRDIIIFDARPDSSLQVEFVTLVDYEAGAGRVVNHNGKDCFVSEYSPSPRAIEQIFKDCLDLKLLKEGRRNCWSLPASFHNLGKILNFHPDSVMWTQSALAVVEEAKIRLNYRTEIAKMIARFKTNGGELPRMPAYWAERSDNPLTPYQRLGAFIGHKTSFALHFDRGVGKTAASVTAVCNLARAVHHEPELHKGFGRKMVNPESQMGTGDQKMIRVLAVVPGQVVLNWSREFKKFATLPGKCVTIQGGIHERVRRLTEAIAADSQSRFSAAIITWDTVPLTMDALSVIPWDMVILDESHYMKDPNTQRFKALKKLRDTSRIRLELTGTPVGNVAFDLWAQLEFLEQGASGFSDLSGFRSKYSDWKIDRNGQGVERLMTLEEAPGLQIQLSMYSMKMSKSEAGLNLPEKVYDIYQVSMSGDQFEAYENMRQEIKDQIEADLNDVEANQSLVVSNSLVRLLKLTQITAGHLNYPAVYSPDGEIIKPRWTKVFGNNPKFEAVHDLLTDPERDPKGKTVIWAHHVPTIENLSAHLTEKGIEHRTFYGKTSKAERDAAVDTFNRDKNMKVIICNPQTASEGLNLLGYDPSLPVDQQIDCYADMEIYVTNSWSHIRRVQSEDRCHRRGTRTRVRIVDVIAPNTIDEVILDRLQSKAELAESITDLREILAMVLRDLT